ncbi:hypothetical protein MTO96_025127 [Rhipicephalus appendiculatus]
MTPFLIQASVQGVPSKTSSCGQFQANVRELLNGSWQGARPRCCMSRSCLALVLNSYGQLSRAWPRRTTQWRRIWWCIRVPAMVPAVATVPLLPSLASATTPCREDIGP